MCLICCRHRHRHRQVVEWEGEGLDDDSVGPYGYTIKYYMIPTEEWNGNIEVFGDTSQNYYNYGFARSASYDRSPVIWSSTTESADLIDVSQSLGLQYTARSIPEEGAASGGAPNSFMFSNQEAVATAVDISQDITNPRCYDYAGENLVLNATSSASALQNFSNLFADSVFYCENCKVTSELLNDSAPEIFFDGTVWCSEGVHSECYEDSCEPYPFAFLNYFIEGDTNKDWEYLGDLCPAGVRQFTKNSQNDYVSGTFRAMSYLNLLANSMLQPTLQSFDIQGGISPYGDLNFEAQLISQNLANVLSVIAMMLLNGFWPLAVWRLAHERTGNIVLMVHTSGMRKLSYMSGMLIFDMTISIMSGVGMVLFAVLLKLSRFEGAPVGYLVTIVITSAFALNGGAQLLVILSRKKASVLPLLAPCLMVASVVTSSLLNILVYPSDGEWKWPLSLYPFLGQGRALYIILVYHRGTAEVDVSIALMVVFGAVALVVSFVLEMENELRLEAKNWLAAVMGAKPRTHSSSAHAPLTVIPTDVQSEAESATTEHDVEGGGAGKPPVDPDVTRETELALAYEPRVDGRQDAMAIVIQNLQHVFPNGFCAVKDLSLALRYSECFALLGPNGAGKSTTISILSGTLLATGGKQYVAGADLQVDPHLIRTSLPDFSSCCASNLCAV